MPSSEPSAARPFAPLPEIPVIDVGASPAAELLRAAPEGAAALLGAARREHGDLLIRYGDWRSRLWLQRAGNPYLAEIARAAQALGAPGGYFLNVSYEWACTTGTGPDPGGEGARLLRVLDWPLEGLGRHLLVARHAGPPGPWLNATWPGFAGVLTAMAPGRFSAAFNQAPLRRRTPLAAADWLIDRIRVGSSRALPPAHLLRQVFETCRDYSAARERLAATPICLPTLFTLSGARPEQGCVIERLEDRAILHEAPAAVANHWLTPALGQDRPRGDLSLERLGCLREVLARPALAADFGWLAPPVLNGFTRVAVLANAAEGRFEIQGWEDGRPATAVLRLREPATRPGSDRPEHNPAADLKAAAG